MERYKIIRSLLRLIVKVAGVGATVGLLAACGGGGGGDVTLSNGPGASSGTSTVTLSGLNGGVVPSGTINTNVAATTFTGECSRGVYGLNVVINGTTETTVPTCDETGNFSYSKTFTDGTYSVVVLPADSTGAALSGGSGFTTNLVIDSTAPAKPAITSGTFLSPSPTVTAGSTSSSTASDANITISGTCPADTKYVTVYASNVLVYTSGANPGTTWSTPVTVGNGTTAITVYTEDAAGNKDTSSPTTLNVTFSASVTLGGYAALSATVPATSGGIIGHGGMGSAGAATSGGLIVQHGIVGFEKLE